MAKPFALQPILELMQTRADEATQRLAKLIAAEQDAKNKLKMLQDYRQEYADRFNLAAQNGLSPLEWQNYQAFLGRIDEAVDAQKKNVLTQERNTEAGQAHWRTQRQKLKAFDTLAVRHEQQETSKELKREQKLVDEFAARSGKKGQDQ